MWLVTMIVNWNFDTVFSKETMPALGHFTIINIYQPLPVKVLYPKHAFLKKVIM